MLPATLVTHNSPYICGMSQMKLVEVTSALLSNAFIRVNVLINRDNPNYIRPLDTDINSVFDPKKNKTFRHGQVARWILQNEDDEPIGRIAPFVNKKYKNKGDELPVGGIGFFDC